MIEHDDAMRELASLHGMGLVPPDESGPVEEHMQTCAICRSEFMEAAAIAAGFAQSVATTPPPGLRDRLLAAIGPKKAAGADSSTIPVVTLEERRLTPRLGWFLPGGVIVALVIAVVAALHSFHSGGVPQPGGTVASHVKILNSWRAACAPKPCLATGSVIALSSGTIQMRMTGLRPLPKNRVYQAWVIPPHAKHPLPESTFRPDRRGNGEVAFTARIGAGTVVAVTEEPSGGSKTPTTKPFLIAPLN